MPIKNIKQHGMSFTKKAMLTALAIGGIGAVNAMHPAQHLIHADTVNTNASTNSNENTSSQQINSTNVNTATPIKPSQAPQLGNQLNSHLLGDSNNNSSTNTPGGSSSSAGGNSTSSTGGSPSGNGSQQQQGTGNGTQGGGNGTQANGNGNNGGGNGSPANNPNNSNNPNNGQPNNANPNNDDPNNVVVPGHSGEHTSNNNNIVPNGAVINNNDASNSNYAPALNDDHQYQAILSSLINGENRDNQDAITRLNSQIQTQANQVSHEASVTASESAAAVSTAEQGANQLQINSMNQEAAINKVKSQIALNKQLKSLSASANSTKTRYMNMMASAEATANSQAMDAINVIRAAKLNTNQRQYVLGEIQKAENDFLANAAFTQSPSTNGLVTDLDAFTSHIKSIINNDNSQNTMNTSNTKHAPEIIPSPNTNNHSSSANHAQTVNHNRFQGTTVSPEEWEAVRDSGYDFQHPFSVYNYNLLRRMGLNMEQIMMFNNVAQNLMMNRLRINNQQNSASKILNNNQSNTATKASDESTKPLNNNQKLVHDDKLANSAEKNMNTNLFSDDDSDANAYAASDDDYNAGYKAGRNAKLGNKTKATTKNHTSTLARHSINPYITRTLHHVSNHVVGNATNKVSPSGTTPRKNVSQPLKGTAKASVNNASKQTSTMHKLPKTGDSNNAKSAVLILATLGMLGLASVDLDRKYNY